MHWVRRFLILSHRYIGIPISFVFVVWFVSAFFMIYTGGMPRITPQMRIEGASALDLDRISVSPDQAASRAGLYPDSVRLRTVLGRPAYDIREQGYAQAIVFADTGEVLGELSQQQARLMSADFLGMEPGRLSHAATLNEADQWTLTERQDLPFYRFTADDELGTEIYVSPRNARVSVYTTSDSRLLAWLGTIPHWFYFTSLRMNQPLWYDIVVWTAGIGCIMALLGLCLAVTQFRRVKPFALSRAIPYRGLLRWHYILGLCFGVVTLTWVFSGLLSMEPYDWTRGPGVDVERDLYREGQLDLAAFPPLQTVNLESAITGQIKEVEYRWILGRPHFIAEYSQSDLTRVKRDRLHQPYLIAGQSRSESVLVDAATGSVIDAFSTETLVERLAEAVPARVEDYALLDEYDDYYYSRNQQLPLPVLRVKLDDPQRSWVYVDPQRAEPLTVIGHWSRVERWLYSGLHSLDFAFWYHRRPLWDIGMIILLAGGLALSGLGLYAGLRRLKRDVRMLAGQWRKADPERSSAGVPFS